MLWYYDSTVTQSPKVLGLSLSLVIFVIGRFSRRFSACTGCTGCQIGYNVWCPASGTLHVKKDLAQ